MDAAEELDAIADQMSEILERFRKSREGPRIAEGDQARFTRLVLEARGLLTEHLGPGNFVGPQLEQERRDGTENYFHSQNYRSVQHCAEITRAGAAAVRSKAATLRPLSNAEFVASDTIAKLRAIPTSPWDLSRLVRMCEELNSVFAAGNYLATAMLVRAILDHVPPMFGVKTFSEYASSVARGSVKENMQRLQQSHRKIADRWLHDRIESGRRETLPDGPQIDCRADLSVLLGQVVVAAGFPHPSE